MHIFRARLGVNNRTTVMFLQIDIYGGWVGSGGHKIFDHQIRRGGGGGGEGKKN